MLSRTAFPSLLGSCARTIETSDWPPSTASTHSSRIIVSLPVPSPFHLSQTHSTCLSPIPPVSAHYTCHRLWSIHTCSERSLLFLAVNFVVFAASAMNEALYKAVMDELPVLISDSDLHISQLVLTLLGTVMDISPTSIKEVFLVLSPSFLPSFSYSLIPSPPHRFTATSCPTR